MTPMIEAGTFAAILLAASACGTTAIGTATTTSAPAAKSAALANGEPCLRDFVCGSGFCDRPMGFCELPGVCRDSLSCLGNWSGESGRPRGGACVSTSVDVTEPGHCLRDLAEGPTNLVLVKPR
jgi:hypothetical protein